MTGADKAPLPGSTSSDGAFQGSPRVLIALINWNGVDQTRECLDSLRGLSYRNHAVLLVDNGSADPKEALALGHEFPSIRVDLLPRNIGFSGGVNHAAEVARKEGYDYVWLLNNDCVVAPSSLDTLLDVACSRSAWVVGSYVGDYEDRNHIVFGGGSFHWRSGRIGLEVFHKTVADSQGEARTTDWVTGANMLVLARSFDAIGAFDSSFFLYQEELEWQLRISGQSRIFIVPRVEVWHRVGATTGSTRSFLGTFFMSRNYLKMTGKHAKRWKCLWYLRWFFDYVLRPICYLNGPALVAGMRGAFRRHAEADELDAFVNLELRGSKQ